MEIRQIAKSIALQIAPIKRLISQRTGLAVQRELLLRQQEVLKLEKEALRAKFRLKLSNWQYPKLTLAQIAEYQKKVEALQWFHSLDLGNGMFAHGVTPMDVLNLHLET